MDHHSLAIVSIAGSSLDVLGALYLTYDLLGGEHGPLRALTRGVTYLVIFALGYGIPLGPVFGIACGVTHAVTLTWEYSLASRSVRYTGFWQDVYASAIRGIGHGIGAASYLGAGYGFAFGVVSALAQVVAYRFGMRPTLDYSPAPRPRITRRQMAGIVNRTIGYGVAAALIGSQAGQSARRALSFGIRIGLSMGLVTTVASACTPIIEWAADRIPAKRMGVLGVGLILVGFSLQSFQYWVSLLDIPLR